MNVVRNPGVAGLFDNTGLALTDPNVQTNMLLVAGGLLAFAWFWRGATSTVRSYDRKRKRRRQTKEQIRALRATL